MLIGKTMAEGKNKFTAHGARVGRWPTQESDQAMVMSLKALARARLISPDGGTENAKRRRLAGAALFESRPNYCWPGVPPGVGRRGAPAPLLPAGIAVAAGSSAVSESSACFAASEAAWTWGAAVLVASAAVGVVESPHPIITKANKPNAKKAMFFNKVQPSIQDSRSISRRLPDRIAFATGPRSECLQIVRHPPLVIETCLP